MKARRSHRATKPLAEDAPRFVVIALGEDCHNAGRPCGVMKIEGQTDRNLSGLILPQADVPPWTIAGFYDRKPGVKYTDKGTKPGAPGRVHRSREVARFATEAEAIAALIRMLLAWGHVDEVPLRTAVAASAEAASAHDDERRRRIEDVDRDLRPLLDAKVAAREAATAAFQALRQARNAAVAAVIEVPES